MAFHLTRDVGTLASAFHAKATTVTIRAQVIPVPGRLARSGRRLRLAPAYQLASAEGVGAACDGSQRPATGRQDLPEQHR